MIKLLQEKDRTNVLNYLNQDAMYNIFIIGDIEAFGFDYLFQHVYAEIDKDGNYKSVFLRHYKSAIYYSDSPIFNKDYLMIFKKEPFTFFSGKPNLLEPIIFYLNNFNKFQMYYCEAVKVLIKNSTKYKVKELQTEEDANKVYNLLLTIKEFSTEKDTREEFIEKKMKSLNTSTTFYIEENGEAISTAATTAETKTHAMVVGVSTRKDKRNKGYATAILGLLMEKYLIQKNNKLCLFYDNPKAGMIYHRLGFVKIGTWVMYEKSN